MNACGTPLHTKFKLKNFAKILSLKFNSTLRSQAIFLFWKKTEVLPMVLFILWKLLFLVKDNWHPNIIQLWIWRVLLMTAQGEDVKLWTHSRPWLNLRLSLFVCSLLGCLFLFINTFHLLNFPNPIHCTLKELFSLSFWFSTKESWKGIFYYLDD